ncbi:unannotated protein [freshwater metagenome]|uniref:Unannotated protein n=1 Tax=freshwater metagenome TaxID=449393 RepID=A0A6J7LS41_9ZZZZ
MYTNFVEMPLVVAVLLILVPLLALTIILVTASGRADHQVRANDNVATAAIRLIGGAFIFMSAFATVALWQESTRLADTVGLEFGHASVIVNQLSAQEVAGTEEIVGHLRTYASIVMDGELINPRVSSSNDGANEQVFEATRGIVKLDAAGTIESDDAKLLFDSLGGMTLARNSRLSQPYPLLPLPIFALVVVLGVSTIIIAAMYPTGPDRTLKWIQSLLAFVVVAGLLSTVTFLLNGSSGWLREDRQRPALLFLQESSGQSLPQAP